MPCEWIIETHLWKKNRYNSWVNWSPLLSEHDKNQSAFDCGIKVELKHVDRICFIFFFNPFLYDHVIIYVKCYIELESQGMTLKKKEFIIFSKSAVLFHQKFLQ